VVCGSFELLKNIGFGSLNIQELENRQFRFLKKFQNQRIVNPGYFKNLNKPMVWFS